MSTDGHHLTRHDGATAPTRLDTRPPPGQDQPGQSEPVWIVRGLPPDLATRYEVVRPLNSRGAQADMLVVRDRRDPDGDLLVVKLYLANASPEEGPYRLLKGASERHVARIVESGLEHGGGYEVMPWFELGSLRDVLDAGTRLDPVAVASQLAAALQHIHSLRLDDEPDAVLVHRDLKPENVLVRSLEPLDLVLGDFGLVKFIRGSLTFSSVAGSDLYSSPESAAAGVASVQGDWWAVGMIVAEIAGGRHPLVGDHGAPTPSEIRFALSQRPVDVTYIADPRLRLLCQGLLVRDRYSRWGAAEVAEWFAGRSPAVVDEMSIRIDAGEVSIGGVSVGDPGALAAALQQQWGTALEQLFQDPDPHLVEAVRALADRHGLTEVGTILDETHTNPVRQLSKLLAALDPSLPARFGPEGIPIRPDELLNLARMASSGEVPDGAPSVDVVRQRLTEVRVAHVLSLWRRLPGMANAPRIEHAWLAGLGDFLTACSSVPDEHRAAIPQDRAEWVLLEWAIDPSSAIALEHSMSTHQQLGAAQQIGWWGELWRQGASQQGDPDLGALLVAQLTFGLAVEEGVREAEHRRLDGERHAEAAREQASQEKVARQRRTLPRYSVLLALGAVVLAAAGYGMWNQSSAADITRHFFQYEIFERVYSSWPVRVGGPLDLVSAVSTPTTLANVLGTVFVAMAIFSAAGAWSFRGRQLDEPMSGGPLFGARLLVVGGGVTFAAYLPVLAAIAVLVLAWILIIGTILVIAGFIISAMFNS